MERLLDDINTLLDDPGGADRDRIERTLTDGYAHALSIEGERLRLAKRMSHVAASLQRGDAAKKAEELATLSRKLDASADELTRLRSVLTDLREAALAARASL